MGTIVLDFSKGKKYDRFIERIFGSLKKMLPVSRCKTIVETNKGEWEMAKKIELSFEEIVKQNERRVQYYIHKLNVRDPHQKFYQKGLVAMRSEERRVGKECRSRKAEEQKKENNERRE